MQKILLILMLAIFTSGCHEKKPPEKKELEYSFFVAGHVYGTPSRKDNNKGLHPPFKEKIDFINQQKKLKLGIILGDAVWMPHLWEYVLVDIKKIKVPVYFARGNHDGKLEDFEKKFGKSYKKFWVDKDLFIILDPNLDKWNISGEQLQFLKNTLQNEGNKARNIFVLSHQVFWYDRKMFNNYKTNYFPIKTEELTYWKEIEPLFRQLKARVYFFAGDVGAFSNRVKRRTKFIEYSYHRINNITYITTGMGGRDKDNFVLADVYKDTVQFRLIHLNGDDIHGLGEIQDIKFYPKK